MLGTGGWGNPKRIDHRKSGTSQVVAIDRLMIIHLILAPYHSKQQSFHSQFIFNYLTPLLGPSPDTGMIRGLSLEYCAQTVPDRIILDC